MLENRDLQPGASQMNRAHQARRAGTDDDDTPVTRHETVANSHRPVLPIPRSFHGRAGVCHRCAAPTPRVRRCQLAATVVFCEPWNLVFSSSTSAVTAALSCYCTITLRAGPQACDWPF